MGFKAFEDVSESFWEVFGGFRGLPREFQGDLSVLVRRFNSSQMDSGGFDGFQGA